MVWQKNKGIIGYIDNSGILRGDENDMLGIIDDAGNVLSVKRNIIGSVAADNKTLLSAGKEKIGVKKMEILL